MKVGYWIGRHLLREVGTNILVLRFSGKTASFNFPVRNRNITLRSWQMQASWSKETMGVMRRRVTLDLDDHWRPGGQIFGSVTQAQGGRSWVCFWNDFLSCIRWLTRYIKRNFYNRWKEDQSNNPALHEISSKRGLRCHKDVC